MRHLSADRLSQVNWRKIPTVWAAFGLAAGITAGFAGAAGPKYSAIVFAPLILVVVVARPTEAILAAIPIVMLPISIEIGELSMQYLLLGIIEIGVIARCAKNTKRFLPLVSIVLVASILLARSLFSTSRVLVTQGAALNSLLALLLCLGVVLSVALTAPPVKRTIQILALSGAGVSLYSAFFAAASVTGRLASEDLNANSTGHIAAITLVTLAGLSLDSRKIWWLALGLPAAYVLLGSESRGALVIVAIGIVALLLNSISGQSRYFIAIASAAIVAFSWDSIQAGESVSISAGRSVESTSQSTEQRSILLHLAFRLILENPLTGIGYRAFPDYSTAVFRTGFNTHNEFLRIAVEAGIPALIAILLVPLWVVFSVPKTWPYRRTALAIIAASSMSFLVGNTASLLPLATPVWVVIGLLWSRRSEGSQRSAIQLRDQAEGLARH